jgi:hypothetical protein
MQPRQLPLRWRCRRAPPCGLGGAANSSRRPISATGTSTSSSTISLRLPTAATSPAPNKPHPPGNERRTGPTNYTLVVCDGCFQWGQSDVRSFHHRGSYVRSRSVNIRAGGIRPDQAAWHTSAASRRSSTASTKGLLKAYPQGPTQTLTYRRICQKVRGSNPFGRTLLQRKCSPQGGSKRPESDTFLSERDSPPTSYNLDPVTVRRVGVCGLRGVNAGDTGFAMRKGGAG